MRPECVVLPAPTIGQDLRLRSGGEQLSVEELIPEPAIERFRESVLPGGSRPMYAVLVVVLASHQSRRAWAMNSGPLSLRMNAGAG